MDETPERKQLSSFEKADEFLTHLQTLLDADLFSDAPSTRAEDHAFHQLSLIVSLHGLF